MVSIWRDPDPPTEAILEEEARILKNEGAWHVNGIYFANDKDAATVRRLEAEKRVRARARDAMHCAWCFDPIPANVTPVEIALRNVHPECAKQFDEWVSENPSANDPRWFAVTDDTPVLWEGRWTVWGELAGNERTECHFNEKGQLVGGFPL